MDAEARRRAVEAVADAQAVAERDAGLPVAVAATMTWLKGECERLHEKNAQQAEEIRLLQDVRDAQAEEIERQHRICDEHIAALVERDQALTDGKQLLDQATEEIARLRATPAQEERA